MSLRARIFGALLLLALVPTAIFALFTSNALERATDRWFRPGVDRAFEAAIETSRVTLTRLEATALDRASDWARTGTLPLSPERTRSEERRVGRV